MRDPQHICDEIFMSKAFSVMGGGCIPYAECLVIARDFAGKLFSQEMIDWSELELQEMTKKWDRI
jgi:hypothetical protein